MTNFPWKTFTRPVLVQIMVIVLFVMVPAILGINLLKQHFLNQIEEQLADASVLLFEHIPTTPPQQWCEKRVQGTEMRLTLIRPDGSVVCDSHENSAHMTNHGERPEVADALAGKMGKSIRRSATLHDDYIYVARLVPNQLFVVRLSVSLHRLTQSIDIITNIFWIVLLGIVAILSIFAVWTGKKLIYPLSQIVKKAKLLLSEAKNMEWGVDLDRSSLILTAEGLREIADAPMGEWSDLDASLDTIHRNLIEKASELTREREEQLALMSAISDAILAVDAHKNILFYNSRFTLLFAKTALKAGTNLTEIFRSPDVVDLFDSVLQKGQAATSIALPLFLDKKRYFSISVSPMKSNKGAIFGAVSVFHDVTELKLAEQIRIDFVANVSHELRTPLTAIKGYVDTLALDFAAHKGDIPETWNEFLRVITRNSSRLSALINDLLDLSSIEAAEPVAKTSIDTGELSERVVQKLATAVGDREQKITINCTAQQVYADPLRIEQVLTNLVDNAVKYSPKGGSIVISWNTDQDGKNTILTVSDNGSGIAPEHHIRLFERFYRVDKGRSRELGGTGLGLAIAKHIMQLHQGSITVDSELGKGTRFTCIFPHKT